MGAQRVVVVEFLIDEVSQPLLMLLLFIVFVSGKNYHAARSLDRSHRQAFTFAGAADDDCRRCCNEQSLFG